MLHFSYYLIMLNTAMTEKIILFDCLHHMVEDPVLTSLLKKTGCATSCASRSAEIQEYVCGHVKETQSLGYFMVVHQ